MTAALDPFAEAVGQVVIAARRLDGAIGVLTAYALDDRSGRGMPGSMQALLRWWGDYIGRVDDRAVRTRHQMAYDMALELGRRRNDTINALGRIAVPVPAVAHFGTGHDSGPRIAMTQHAVLDLRYLAAAIDAHVAVVLDLADEVRDGARI